MLVIGKKVLTMAKNLGTVIQTYKLGGVLCDPQTHATDTSTDFKDPP
jgi:hypothetical protein